MSFATDENNDVVATVVTAPAVPVATSTIKTKKPSTSTTIAPTATKRSASTTTATLRNSSYSYSHNNEDDDSEDRFSKKRRPLQQQERPSSTEPFGGFVSSAMQQRAAKQLFEKKIETALMRARADNSDGVLDLKNLALDTIPSLVWSHSQKRFEGEDWWSLRDIVAVNLSNNELISFSCTESEESDVIESFPSLQVCPQQLSVILTN